MSQTRTRVDRAGLADKKGTPYGVPMVNFNCPWLLAVRLLQLVWRGENAGVRIAVGLADRIRRSLHLVLVGCLLPVATFCSLQLPAILFQDPDNIPNLHGVPDYIGIPILDLCLTLRNVSIDVFL